MILIGFAQLLKIATIIAIAGFIGGVVVVSYVAAWPASVEQCTGTSMHRSEGDGTASQTRNFNDSQDRSTATTMEAAAGGK